LAMESIIQSESLTAMEIALSKPPSLAPLGRSAKPTIEAPQALNSLARASSSPMGHPIVCEAY